MSHGLSRLGRAHPRAYPLLLWALVLFGCGSAPKLPVTEMAPLPPRGVLHAGAASVDITPPPGLGMFAHGPESRVAVGHRTRLRCQIIVLQGPAMGAAEDAGESREDAVALVTCDLGQPSWLLQRRIVERARELGVPLGDARVMLFATHTHAGPGHYFDSKNLSGIFSSRLTGHDPAVVRLLSERIARGLKRAYDDLEPARIAWDVEPVYGLSRNRTLQALERNDPLPKLLREAAADPALADRYGMAERMVDPRLAVLRIDQVIDGKLRPRALFAVFGVHPTVIENREDLYGGDLFGYATRELEARIETSHPLRVQVPFVAALANGIEGDVAPNLDKRGPAEARRLGHVLAGRAESLWEGLETKLRADAPLDVAYRELRFDGARISDGGPLCPHPALGSGSAGGAGDNPTSLRALPQMNPGVRASTPAGCHGDKFPILQPGGDATPGEEFPGQAPIALMRIGELALATVPGELTTVAGLRVRDSILAQARQADDLQLEDVMIVGLAGQYMQYVATAEEYPLQQYEGASTLYGPHTAALLREQHACLAASLFRGAWPEVCTLQTSELDKATAVPYATGPAQSRLPSAPRNDAQLQLPGAPYAHLTDDGLAAISLDFEGPEPGALICVDALRASVLDTTQDNARVDDGDGQHLSLRWLGEAASGGGASWRLQWTPEPDVCGGAYRFQVTSGAQRRRSALFQRPCPDESSAPAGTSEADREAP